MTVYSLQSQVLDAVVALLGGPVKGVYRTRFTPFAIAELPAINVLPDEEQNTPDTTDGDDIRFRFLVRHMGAAVDEVDKAIDPLYVQAMQQILADSTLGGLVRFTRYISRKWEFEKAEYDQAALTVIYEVEFSTSRTDPSVAGY